MSGGAAAPADARCLSRLAHLVAVRVHGADAGTFLHAQLSNDIAALPAGHCQLNAYCDPKGRTLATMLVCRRDDDWLLLLAADLADALLARLQMFVLRAKVTLELLDVPLYGLAGPGVEAELPARPAPGALIEGTGYTVIALPAGEPRFVLLDASGTLGLRLADAGLPADNQGVRWRWHDIRNAWPHVQAGTSGQLVPQMLNLDLLEGISFRKGCYPGQEVVARMRYLGKLKQRMLLAHTSLENPPAPGDRVACADGASLGVVVDAQPDPGGGCLVLAAVRFREIHGCQAVLPDGQGAQLEWLAMPYGVPELDEEPSTT